MKRLCGALPERDHLRLFGDFAAIHGGSLEDPDSQAAFLGRVAAALRDRGPTAVHGLPVEAMCAHVAAALGECRTS